jgi:hypothetical protein
MLEIPIGDMRIKWEGLNPILIGGTNQRIQIKGANYIIGPSSLNRCK